MRNASKQQVVLLCLFALFGVFCNSSVLDTDNGWLKLHSCVPLSSPTSRGDELLADNLCEDGSLLCKSVIAAEKEGKASPRAVFVKGPDGNVWSRWVSNITGSESSSRYFFSDWLSFSSPNNGGVKELPSVTVNAQNLQVVVAISAVDGQLYSIFQENGDYPFQFSSWKFVGGSSLPAANGSRDPVAIQSKDGRVFVFVIGGDSLLYLTQETAPSSYTWTPWVQIAGNKTKINGKVSVALNKYTGLLEAFAVSDDYHLYQAWQLKKETWHNWRPLWDSQPKFNSYPVVRTRLGNFFNAYLEIFIRGQDNSIWHAYQTTCDGVENPWSQCTWGGYSKIGKDCPAPQDQYLDLQVASNIHGGLEVFVTSVTGHLYHIYQVTQGGSWTKWEDLGAPSSGALTSQPTLIQDQSGWWIAYARGANGDIQVYIQDRQFDVSPRSVPYGGTIQVSWSIPEDEACNDDWIGIYEPQANNTQFLDSLYVQGKSNPLHHPVPQGSVSFNLYLPEGMYEVRYLVNKKPKDVLRVLVKVSNSSTMNPTEQIFSGMTIGLGAQAVNFDKCVSDWQTTFKTFQNAFDAFGDRHIIEGLNLLGKGIEDYTVAMATCSQTSVAKAVKKFAADLIACTETECVGFIIDIAAEILVVYERNHEIYHDIQAANNDWSIQAYEEYGIKIGDLIQAVISPPW